MKKSINILLILLLMGLPNLLAFTTIEMECCHNPAPVEKQEESHSCCEIEEEPVKQTEPACDMFEMTSSSLDNCGCIHDLDKVDDTVLINSKINFEKTLLVESIKVNGQSQENSFIDRNLEISHYQDLVPIYISVSSYLI